MIEFLCTGRRFSEGGAVARNRRRGPGRTRLGQCFDIWRRFVWLGLMAGALGFGGSVAPAAPATPATPSAKAAGQVHRAPDVVPQSVFIDDPTFGCDPFFPESARRRSKINPNNGKPSAETAEKKLFSLLTVKGILGPKDNRMALINRYLFKVGDERNMKVGEGSVIHVKCLGITDHSVSVAIAGNSEILELPFPPRPVKTAPVGSPRAAPRSAH